jgi:hypothetical protein
MATELFDRPRAVGSHEAEDLVVPAPAHGSRDERTLHAAQLKSRSDLRRELHWA